MDSSYCPKVLEALKKDGENVKKCGHPELLSPQKSL